MSATRLLSIAAGLAIISACADTPMEPLPLEPSMGHVGGLVPFVGVVTHTSQDLDSRPGPSFDPGCESTAAEALQGEVWRPQPTTFGDVKATHVGTSSLTQNGCVEISNAPAGPFQAIGEATITSANGDEVHYTYEGTVHPFPDFGADVDVTIIGGTGRFAGASGGFSASSTGSVFEFPVVYPFSGTISSVGSLR